MKACSAIHLVAAVRPNFMKVAPVFHALAGEDWCRPILVHGGQHYDPAMSDAFLRDLELPQSQHHLGVGSGTHAEQTSRAMTAYEGVCRAERPDLTIVVGDVNVTMACALTAAKLGIPVAHLEAGLRSGDRTMPEEINRLVTDAIADLLWTPSRDADANLLREGIDANRIECVGNVMIDSLEMQRLRIERADMAGRMGLRHGGYVVATFHRPGNVDDRTRLAPLVEQIAAVGAMLPVVFPVHPRTAQRLAEHGLAGRLEEANVRLIEPLGYIDFMSLVLDSSAVITDSGGVQEETSYLRIPCVTARPSTERPVTLEHGTNRLVALDGLADAIARIVAGDRPAGEKIEFWDGRTAERVRASLRRFLAAR